VAAKEDNAYYQWEIMKMLNLEDEEIKKYGSLQKVDSMP